MWKLRQFSLKPVKKKEPQNENELEFEEETWN